MLRTLVGLMIALPPCAVSAADDTTKPSKPTLEAVSLVVMKKHDEKNFFSTNQTTLTLKVSNPGKQLIGIDPSSKLTSFKDDKDASLLATGLFAPPAFNPYVTMGKDRTSMLVNVATFTVP